MAIRIVGEEIERLSLQGIVAVNARDWDYTTLAAREFLERISEDFQLLSPDSPAQNWDQAVRQWKQAGTHYPNLYIEVVHVSSHVRLKDGWASVHIQSNVTGAEDNIKFAWLSQRCWRFDKAKEKWMCYEMSGMRGTQSLTGFL